MCVLYGCWPKHLEGEGLGIEDIHLEAVELRGVPEGLLRARGVLHEDGVHGRLSVLQPELVQALAVADRLFQLASDVSRPQNLRLVAGLVVYIPLLVQGEVIHNGDLSSRNGPNWLPRHS